MIYLDHAATTPLLPEVLDEMLPYLKGEFGNPSAVYSLGRTAFEAVSGARGRCAEILGCSEDEIIFTGSGTESVNMAIKGIARAAQGSGRHIVSTTIEHNAVLETLRYLEEEEDFEVTLVEVDTSGVVKVEDIKSALRDDTVLVSVMYANNEIGTIQPIKEIGEALKSHSAVFHTDACQAPGFLELNFETLGVDALTLNGSKMYGPKGMGMLYLKNTVEALPLVHGGGQEMEMRGGTENVAGIVGFAKALELAEARRAAESARLMVLRDTFFEEILKRIPGAQVNGCRERRLPHNVNISFSDVEGESLLVRLDGFGIAASSGAACSSHTMAPSHVLEAIGVKDDFLYGSLRLSLGLSTSEKDLDIVVSSLQSALVSLRGTL